MMMFLSLVSTAQTNSDGEPLLRMNLFTDLSSAKTDDDYQNIIDQRLSSCSSTKATCDWEASEILFAWLTDNNARKSENYDARLLFKLIQNSIESGAAEKLGVQLNSIYGFGMFGVPKDEELAICWTRIGRTTIDNTSVEQCQAIEVKKYGIKSPWLHGFR